MAQAFFYQDDDNSPAPRPAYLQSLPEEALLERFRELFLQTEPSTWISCLDEALFMIVQSREGDDPTFVGRYEKTRMLRDSFSLIVAHWRRALVNVIERDYRRGRREELAYYLRALRALCDDSSGEVAGNINTYPELLPDEVFQQALYRLLDAAKPVEWVKGLEEVLFDIVQVEELHPDFSIMYLHIKQAKDFFADMD